LLNQIVKGVQTTVGNITIGQRGNASSPPRKGRPVHMARGKIHRKQERQETRYKFQRVPQGHLRKRKTRGTDREGAATAGQEKRGWTWGGKTKEVEAYSKKKTRCR